MGTSNGWVVMSILLIAALVPMVALANSEGMYVVLDITVLSVPMLASLGVVD